ncbi:MAG: GNAT family N-acetyltransferase [Pricia sp.]
MAPVRIVDYFSLEDTFCANRSETLFCSPAWVRTLHKTYGFNCYAAIDDDRDIYIPLVLVDNLMGKKCVSLPFSDYTDIDTDSPEKYASILSAIKNEFPNIPITFKTIGNSGTVDNELWGEAIRTAYYHRIDTRDISAVKGMQSSSFKRNVKKAKKNGISVTIKKDSTALSAFYRLYCHLRLNKFNSIPQPFVFFENVFDAFIAKDNGFLIEAVVEEKVIASCIILAHKNILYYKFGASDEAHLDLRPNNLLFDELIRHACEKGFQAVDLGLSGTGDSYKGLVRFKESMGGVAHNIVYYQKDATATASKNEALGQWLGSLTNEIVSAKPDTETLSRYSQLIYPLFA